MAAQSYKGPLDYIDVATRIVEFRKQYPEGRLRRADLQFIDFAGKSWVVYTAEAWRTPDDPAPAQGTAWEPVPGPTQFTRDSEVQNAETAAWGRAMVAALAVDTKKGIASSEEVRNRQTESPRTTKKQADAAANVAIQKINHATNLDALRDVWEALDPKVRALVDVLQAKDARKAQLETPPEEAWAPVAVIPE